MDIRDLPRLLFQELGEETHPHVDKMPYDSDFRSAFGGKCFLMLRESPDEVTLIVWVWPGQNATAKLFLEVHGDDAWGDLAISAGSFNSGTWSAGMGNHKQETVKVHVFDQTRQLPEYLEYLEVMARITNRAVELLRTHPFEFGSFWEAELDPSRWETVRMYEEVGDKLKRGEKFGKERGE